MKIDIRDNNIFYINNRKIEFKYYQNGRLDEYRSLNGLLKEIYLDTTVQSFKGNPFLKAIKKEP